VLARLFGNSTAAEDSAAAAEERFAVASQLKLTWWRFRRHKLAVASGVIVILFYLLAGFADFLATMDPHDTDARRTYAPPQAIRFFDDDWSFKPHTTVLRARRDPRTFRMVRDQPTKVDLALFVEGYTYDLFGLFTTNVHLLGLKNPQSGETLHLLGTDRLGRDILSRIIWGSRVSLAAGVVTVLVASAFGAAIGLVAGYYGGRTDAALMRITDATMSFPVILLALILAVTVGPSFTNVVIAIAVILWARYARVIRGQVLTLMGLDFIAQARIAGAGAWRIITRHLLPNTMNTLVVLVTLQVGYVIIVEASLSFLGAGIPPPTPAWGSMIAEGREFVTSAWWASGLPGLAILLVVLAFNLLGDWLRDTLDPKLRQL
jgi:peptide/nickel transport system permease protein